MSAREPDREHATRRDDERGSPDRGVYERTDAGTSGIDASGQSETVEYTRDGQPSTLGSPLRDVPTRESPSDARRAASRSFGHYELLEEIARGGMGVVYKARQLKLNRVVALKMILAGQFATPKDVERFYTEAEAAARLDHPGIVPIYEVDEVDGQHFYSMGFVDGPSLAERASQHPYSPREAAELMCRVAEAVQYAHDRGIVHRDLKPRNILLTVDGEPKITDFGLAAKIESDHELTASGQVLGTPSYMPPEQAGGRVKQVGPHSDVYSVGAVLYYLLTGRPPFQTGSVVETIKLVLESEPVPPRLLNPSVDRDLETICLKCLEKDIGKRYGSASGLADDLRRFLDGEPIRARRIGLAGRAWRWIRRKPLAAALYASILAVVVVGLISAFVAQRALHAWRFADLNRRFESGLEQAIPDKDYLGHMEGLLQELAELAPTEVSESQQRLHAAYANRIRLDIREPKHEPEDVLRITSAIAILESRSPRLAAELTAEFERRQSQWDTVFLLRAPFDDLASVFPKSPLAVDGSGKNLILPTDQGRGTGRPISSNSPSRGSVQLAATFDAAWEQCGRLGVVLNLTPRQSYEFLLLAAVPRIGVPAQASPGNGSPRTFAHLREQDGSFVAVIARNGMPLLSHEIHQARIPPGPLTVRGTRQRGHLAIQINSLPPRSFRDPFPLRAATEGLFAVALSPGVGLHELHAQTRARAPEPSALEHGDELFDEDRYEEALAFYQQQARESSDVEFSQEARYKQATCLVQLNRLDEAVALLQQLITEPHETWPPLAGCQLWMIYLDQNKVGEAEAVYQTLSSRFNFEQFAALVPESLRWKIMQAYRANFQTVASVLRYDPQLLEKMERLAAVDRLFSDDGRGEALTQIEVARAYRYLGDLPSALRVVEPLARETTNATVMRHYTRLLRLTGQPDEALRRLEEAFQDPVRGVMRQNVTLRVELARIHAALGQWEQCEALIDELYRAHRFEKPLDAGELSYVTLIKGFLLERRGANRPALGVWREGFQAIQPALSQTPEVQADLLNGLILGSLTDQLTGADAQGFFARTVAGGGDNAVLRLAESIVSPQTLQSVMQQMWKSEIGRQYAQAYAYETMNMRERFKTPLILAGVSYFRLAGTQGDYSRQHEELLFNSLSTLFDDLFVQGNLGIPQIAQLTLSWKGTTNFLGWEGAAKKLEPKHRGSIAYFLAHRFLRLNNPTQAVGLLETAISDQPTDSALAALAQRDLQLLKAGQGLLTIQADFPEPVSMIVRQAGQEVARQEVAFVADLQLPAGDYTLDVDDAPGPWRLSSSQVTLSAGCQRIVSLRWLWKPNATSEILPGLVPQPSSSAVGGRWQLFHRDPGMPVQGLAWSPDGRWIAAGANDGTIRLIDAGDLRLANVLVGRSRCPRWLCWHPDSRRLASFHDDHRGRVWSVETGAQQFVLDGHQGAILCGGWNASGKTLATGSEDRTIRLWTEAGTETGRLMAGYEVQSIAWSGDGLRLASLGYVADVGYVVDIWGTASEQVLHRIEMGHGRSTQLAWSPGDRWLAVAGPAEAVTIYGIDDWTPSRTLGGGGEIRLLAFSGTENRLIAAIRGRGLMIWDLESSDTTPARTLEIANLREAAWSPDAARVAATRETVRFDVIDAEKAESLPIWSGRAETTCLAISPDGGTTAVGTSDGRLRIVGRDGRLRSQLEPNPHAIVQANWSPRGDRLAIALADGTVQICDSTGQTIFAVRCEGDGVPTALVWNPTGERVLIAAGQKSLFLVQPETPQIERLYENQPHAITAADWSSKNTIAIGDGQGNVRVLDAAGSQLQHTRLHAGGPVIQLMFRPDGNQLAALDSSHQTCVSLTEGSSDPVYLERGQDTTRIAWSPDSRRLAAVTDHGDLRCWDDQYHLIHDQQIHAVRLSTVAWEIASPTVLVAGESPAIWSWHVDSRRPGRVQILLSGAGTALVKPSGEVVSAPLETFEADLVYGLETESGGMESLSAEEFHRRFQLPWPPAQYAPTAAAAKAGE